MGVRVRRRVLGEPHGPLQEVRGGVLTPEAPGRVLPAPPSSCCGPWFSVSLACGHVTLASSFIFTWPVPVSLCPLLCKDTSHWVQHDLILTNHTCKDPVSTSGPVHTYQGSGLQRMTVVGGQFNP